MAGKNEAVVRGEASESDDDGNTETLNVKVKSKQSLAATPSMSKGIVVAGEASESDEEEDTFEEDEVHLPPPSKTGFTPLQVDSMKRGDSVELSDNEPKSPILSKPEDKPKYDTLLHKKLREKNANFRRNLCDTVGQIYISGAKEIKHITQELVKTQTSVQDVSQTMRLLTNDLFHLEDKIDIVASCNLLPDINIDIPANNGATASTTMVQS